MRVFILVFLVGCTVREHDTRLVPDARPCECNPDYSDQCEVPCTCGGAVCASGRCFNHFCITPDPAGAICEFDEECPSGTICIGRCTSYACVEEECDGFDNNCDGVVDGTAAGPLSRWCGPLDACRRGAQACSGGHWGPCTGVVENMPEVGYLLCDGVDNDCDGCVDCGEDVSLDIAVVMDISGSMEYYLQPLKRAVEAVHSALPARYALLAVSETVEVRTDFDGNFSEDLAALVTNGGFVEPTIDALYGLGSGEIYLSWRPGSTRLILLLTDEEPQGIRHRSVPEACTTLRHGEIVYIMTLGFLFPQWTCGETRPLSNDLVGVLAEAFVLPCER